MTTLDDLRAALGLNPQQQTTWESFSQVISPSGVIYPSLGVPFVTGNILTIPTQIFSPNPYVPAHWVIITPRSMGTSAWVRIGNSHGQVTSLYAVTDALILSDPAGFDAAQLFAVSQNGDVTLEVTAMLPQS